jgi:type II secretory pathway component PulF
MEVVDTRRCGECGTGAVAAARKCGQCGEWLDAPYVLTGAAKLALFVVGAEIAAMVWMRAWLVPALEGMFAEFGTVPPVLTRLALGDPTVVLLGGVLAAAAGWALARVRRVRRRETMLVALAGIGFALVGFALWAMYLPIIELAGNVES